MEYILIVLLIIAIPYVIRVIVAGGKSIVTDRSFSENMRGIPDLDFRMRDDKLTHEDGSKHSFKAIEMRGLLPITKTTNLASVVTLADVTDYDVENSEDRPRPVISYLEVFQDTDSPVFLLRQDLGRVSVGDRAQDWLEVGRVFPDLVQPPFGGWRKLVVGVFLVDSGNPPPIHHGIVYESKDGNRGIAFEYFSFEHSFEEKGYEEEAEDRDKAKGLAVDMAMSIAMSDNAFHDAEGNVIKKWIEKAIEPYSDDRKETLKNVYNASMKTSYNLARRGELSLSDLTRKMNELDVKKIKYEAVELCYDVMAADGNPHPEELRNIRLIGAALNLDMDELEKIRDQKLISVSTHGSSESSIDEIVGIEKDWDQKKIKSHLMSEFRKWNNRVTALPEGEERDNAQMMLDKIAEARKRYDS